MIQTEIPLKYQEKCHRKKITFEKTFSSLKNASKIELKYNILKMSCIVKEKMNFEIQ